MHVQRGTEAPWLHRRAAAVWAVTMYNEVTTVPHTMTRPRPRSTPSGFNARGHERVKRATTTHNIKWYVGIIVIMVISKDPYTSLDVIRTCLTLISKQHCTTVHHSS
jgi:hypothetical protein